MRRGRQDHHQHPHQQPSSGGSGNNHHKKKTAQQNNTNDNKKGSSDHKQNGPKAPSNNASSKNNNNNYHHNNKNNKNNTKSRSSPPPPVSNQSTVHHQIQQHRQQNQNLMSSSYSSSSMQQQQGSTTASVVPTTVKMLVRANTAQSWGIQIFDLTPPQTINNNHHNSVRFKVEDVEPFSPAYHGGLRGGDVIVGVVESSDQNQNRSMTMNFRNFDEFGALLQNVVSIRLRVERRDDDRSGANHQYPLPPSMYSSSQVQETMNSHQPASSAAASSPKQPSSNPQQKDNSTKVTASAKKAVVREEDEPVLATTTTTTTTAKLMSLPDAPPSNGKKELGWLNRLVAPSVALPSLSVLSSKILTSAEDQKLISEMKIPQREIRMRASSEIEAESKYFADLLAMKVKEGV